MSSLPSFSSTRKLHMKQKFKPVSSVIYKGEIFENSFMQLTSQVEVLNSSNSHDSHSLQAFTSDGCSSFPDGTFNEPTKWQHCCVAHDIQYWVGGTSDERLKADQGLRQCVADAANSVLAEMMYRGVRIGGAPNLKTTWRWGYGWKQLRAYRPHSNTEAQEITRMTEEFGISLMDTKITDPILNYFKLPSKHNNYCIDEAVHSFKEKYGNEVQIDSIKYSSRRMGIKARRSYGAKVKTYVTIKSSLCEDEIIYEFGKIKNNLCTKAVYQEKSPATIKQINATGDCKGL